MLVKTLNLRQFRNHELKNFNFAPGINTIVGPNAIGKTNVVEAIYYLSLARSFRGVEDADLIQKEKEFAEIYSEILEGSLKKAIRILITKKGRQVLVNDKKVSKLSELSKCVNVLLFEPKDVMLFRGSPKERRNFLNINLAKKSNRYLEYITRYERALKERNELLKNGNVDKKLLDSLTELLVEYSAPIIEFRSKYIKDINDILIKIARALTGVKGTIEIKYKPSFTLGGNYKEEALNAYKRSLESDLKHKATSIGVHREDFTVSLNGRDIGTYGSQGENRLVAIALKLAPYFLIEERDKRPIVVLDDVMSELDKNHREKLIKFLRKFEQVFITGTKLEIEGATQINLN